MQRHPVVAAVGGIIWLLIGAGVAVLINPFVGLVLVVWGALVLSGWRLNELIHSRLLPKIHAGRDAQGLYLRIEWFRLKARPVPKPAPLLVEQRPTMIKRPPEMLNVDAARARELSGQGAPLRAESDDETVGLRAKGAQLQAKLLKARLAPRSLIGGSPELTDVDEQIRKWHKRAVAVIDANPRLSLKQKASVPVYQEDPLSRALGTPNVEQLAAMLEDTLRLLAQ